MKRPVEDQCIDRRGSVIDEANSSDDNSSSIHIDVCQITKTSKVDAKSSCSPPRMKWRKTKAKSGSVTRKRKAPKLSTWQAK